MITADDNQWETWIKQALKSWHQSVELGQNPLTRLTIVASQRAAKGYEQSLPGLAQALRDVLRQGIQALGVPGQSPPERADDPAWFERDWRLYNILTLRFMRGLSRLEIQQRIGLAEGGQYYEAQRKAITLLTTLLREWEGAPQDEMTAVVLEYPSGALKLSDAFYIERQSDADLLAEIRRPGHTMTITGPRQVGKTSLLVRGVQAARQMYGAQVVYLDLQSMSQESLHTQPHFYQEFAYALADELALDPVEVERVWQTPLADGRKLTRLLERAILPALDAPLLLVLDEVDRLLPTGYHADFFGLLRSWHNLRARNGRWETFSLLMAISTEPYLLINDMQQSPFNVGLMVYLQDFTELQVRELNGRYQTPIPEADIPALYHLLNGHPYLTRVALYTLAKDSLTLADLLATAVTEAGPFISHLRTQHRLVTTDAVLVAAMKQVLTHNTCADDLARYRLLKAGLIKQVGTAVACRCDLYRQYFAQTL